MLVIKKLKMRNFFSFGNNAQEIDFTETDLALILGQNNDASLEGGDSEERRNGAGKSAIVHGLVYGLFGKSIDNSIKIPNMINNINEKGCEVSVEFSRNGKTYLVERGRSPTYFRFNELDENGVSVQDDTRGETASTQEDLTSIIGISQTLFEHIVVQNTTVQSFLTLGASKQRELIEELLGLTQLSEKAVMLKDMARETRQKADNVKFQNDTIIASNERITKSIELLKQNSTDWESNKAKRIASLLDELNAFEGLDLDALLAVAVEKQTVLMKNREREALTASVLKAADRQEQFNQSTAAAKKETQRRIDELSTLDINAEVQAHTANEERLKVQQRYSEIDAEINGLQSVLRKHESAVTMSKLKLSNTMKSIQEMEQNVCPSCKQDIPCTDEHTARLAALHETAAGHEKDINEAITNANMVQDEINSYEHPVVPAVQATYYKTKSEADLHQHKVLELQKSLDEVVVNPYDKDVSELLDQLDNTPELPVPESDFTPDDVKDLTRQKQTIEDTLLRESDSVNPYVSQIQTLEQNSIQEVSFDQFNQLMKLAEHQEVLQKMLQNKDSFVRRQIIEQSIPFLNSRLEFYIDAGGSQHKVQFQNDLGVEIICMGRELDFNQLSRGEKLRVVLALNNAFRDTYESLYQSINLLVVDELIDNGMDISGRERAWRILQDMSAVYSKNIYVVSHHEELVSKSENVMKVVKENGFSTVTRHKSYDM